MRDESGKEKVPPIDLGKEAEERRERESIARERERKREEADRGPLSYAEQRRRPSSGTPPRQGLHWGTALAGAIIAVVVSLAIVFTMAAPKAVEDDLAAMQGQFSALTATVEANGEILSNTVNTMGEYAKKSELGNYAPLSSVDGLTGLPAQVDGKVTDLQAYTDQALVERDAKIATLEARITELEVGGGAGGATPIEEVENEVWVDMKWSDRFQFPTDSDSDPIDAYSQSISFKVVNDSELDIEDVEISMIIHSRGVSVPFDAGAGQITVSGGYPLAWQVAHVENGVIVLNGITPSWGDGLIVEADDSETIFMTLNMITTSDMGSVVNMFVEAEIEDFKVVE